MGELNLDEIRRNAEWYRVNREGRQGAVEAHAWCAAAINCAEDVPALLAEVDRLRAAIAAARGVMTSRLGADRQIEAHAARGDSAEVIFYSGALLALAKIHGALRGGESDG